MKKSEHTTRASSKEDKTKKQIASNHKFTDKERKKEEAEKHNLGGF